MAIEIFEIQNICIETVLVCKVGKLC